MALSNFVLRTGSAIVLAPAILWIVWQGGGVFFLLLLTVILLLTPEWDRLMGPSTGGSTNVVFATFGVGSLLAGWFVGYVEALLLATVATCSLAFLAWCRNRKALLAGFGTIYIILPFLSLIWLRNQPEIGATVVVWLFLVVWASDVFAYLIGRTVGGVKLAPSISPRKTWAGLFGGLGGAGFIGGVTGAYLIAFQEFVFDTWALSVFCGILVGFLAQIGDLWESWLKRRRMLKDSGNIIPGHGGLLDRLDGLLISTPAMAVLVWTNG